MFLTAVSFFASIFFLWFGADWIVESASKIARRFNVSELVIGLTIVAFGTSAPEFLVTATAAFKGYSDISLSNVVGSNIFNLGFILGLMAIIKPLPTNRSIALRDTPLLLITTAFILLMAYFDFLGRTTGAILMSALIIYLGYLMIKTRKTNAAAAAAARANGETIVNSVELGWKDWSMLVAGFAGIAIGGELMVESASTIAAAFGVSKWAIGMTIVAAGTSLPEMVTCLAASVKGRNEMLLGNLIGSDFFNFAGVLGLTCLMRPLGVTPEAMPGLAMLVAMVALVLVFVRTGWRVSRTEGAILVGLSIMRWVQDFMM